MPTPVVLGLAVVALLAAFGAGAALLPGSLTGPGSPAEEPGAAVAALAPGAGGGVPGAGASSAPAAPGAPPAPPPASPSVTPSAKPTVTASPSKSPTRTATKKPQPRRTTASKKPAATSAPKAGSGQTAQENEVIRLTNIERDKAGCGPVELDTRLRTAMRLHVEELGTHGGLYISHVSDDGRSFADRAREQGYDAPGGENVARGQRDAADVMKSWMNSDGHRANIVNCSFKAIGVGMAKGVDGTLVWGQIFGRS
jgi:uncharacterized protein YkwD